MEQDRAVWNRIVQLINMPRVSEADLLGNIGQYPCVFCGGKSVSLSFSDHSHPLSELVPVQFQELEKNKKPFNEEIGYVFGICDKCCPLQKNVVYKYCCICPINCPSCNEDCQDHLATDLATEYFYNIEINCDLCGHIFDIRKLTIAS